MFRSTRSLAATIFRGNITSKRGNKNFYKGRGAPLMGHMTRKGRFIVDSDKFHAKTFTVPDLTACEFKPYVSRVDPAFGKKRVLLRDGSVFVHGYLATAPFLALKRTQDAGTGHEIHIFLLISCVVGLPTISFGASKPVSARSRNQAALAHCARARQHEVSKNMSSR